MPPRLKDSEEIKGQEWLACVAALPLAPVIGSVPDLGEAACVLDRSHGGHTEGKEALLDRVVCPAHLSAVGKPTALTPAFLVGPPGSEQDHPVHGVRQDAWDVRAPIAMAPDWLGH